MPSGKGKVLIVEDEDVYVTVYTSRLAPLGYVIDVAMDVETASEKLSTFQPDIVVLDLRLQRQDSEEGFSLLTDFVAYNPDTKVIVVTVEGTIQNAMKALRLGAYDFIEKRTQGFHELQFRVNQAYEKLQLERQIATLQRSEIDKAKGYRYGRNGIIVGNSELMYRLYEQIDQVAPTHTSVLILGESGTGKELVASAIHHKSTRSEKPFVTVACGQTEKELLGSELFGHERGAFTGATTRRIGKFERADGGTIFLDELGELDATSQVKLLRVLQERQFERMGGGQSMNVDVRVIAATNKDIAQAVEDGVFREDLYHRLDVFPIHVPPLRERKSDIPLLAAHFLAQKSQGTGRKHLRGFQEAAMSLLIGHAWPGNVREFENRVEQAVVLVKGDWISAADIRLDAAMMSDSLNRSLNDLIDEYERALIIDALERAGDQKAAAQRLGIPEPTIRYKMDKHDIQRSRAGQRIRAGQRRGAGKNRKNRR